MALEAGLASGRLVSVTFSGDVRFTMYDQDEFYLYFRHKMIRRIPRLLRLTLRCIVMIGSDTVVKGGGLLGMLLRYQKKAGVGLYIYLTEQSSKSRQHAAVVVLGPGSNT